MYLFGNNGLITNHAWTNLAWTSLYWIMQGLQCLVDKKTAAWSETLWLEFYKSFRQMNSMFGDFYATVII